VKDPTHTNDRRGILPLDEQYQSAVIPNGDDTMGPTDFALINRFGKVWAQDELVADACIDESWTNIGGRQGGVPPGSWPLLKAT